MINKITYTLAAKNKKYVAVVESSKGIIANTVPNKDREFHFKFIKNIQTRIESNDTEISSSESLATNILFSLENDPLGSWSRSKDLPIDFQLYTTKQQRVAEQLRNLPLGQIVSYGKLAELSGINKGARFVGNCMSANFIPLIIPCHRVIRSNGSLGNYSAGGPDVKIRLLLQEGVII